MDNKLPTFPSKEWFEMMKKKSSNEENTLSSQIRVNEDPNKGIIRFLMNERENFIRNR